MTDQEFFDRAMLGYASAGDQANECRRKAGLLLAERRESADGGPTMRRLSAFVQSVMDISGALAPEGRLAALRTLLDVTLEKARFQLPVTEPMFVVFDRVTTRLQSEFGITTEVFGDMVPDRQLVFKRGGQVLARVPAP